MPLDITPFVSERYAALRRDGAAALQTPVEHVYPVTGTNQLGVDEHVPGT